jgi:phosphate starvation-inducible PhoH-like protein
LKLKRNKRNKPEQATTKNVSEPAAQPRFKLKPRNQTQRDYLEAIAANDVTFGLGPAGTGKTFLAVAAAVEAILSKRVSRILLVRPAVEAGEKLGYLPGTLQEKIDPYLRPLYDALYEMLPADKVTKMLADQVIEVAPLAFMRGRTLKSSFVILDEAQNTTVEQIKMLLTRMGEGSKIVVTGDATQNDLPKHTKSGLTEAFRILKRVEGVGYTTFSEHEVVRHPMVQRIVRAWEEDQARA